MGLHFLLSHRLKNFPRRDRPGLRHIMCLAALTAVPKNRKFGADRASRMWSAVHLGDLQGRLHEAQRTLDLTRWYLDELEVLAHRLLDVDLPASDWESLVGKLLPMPEDAGKIRKRNIAALREDLLARIRAPDLARFRETGWAAVNAVADHVAHVIPLRQVTGWRESRFARIAFGHPLLDRAVDLLLEGN